MARFFFLPFLYLFLSLFNLFLSLPLSLFCPEYITPKLTHTHTHTQIRNLGSILAGTILFPLPFSSLLPPQTHLILCSLGRFSLSFPPRPLLNFPHPSENPYSFPRPFSISPLNHPKVLSENPSCPPIFNPSLFVDDCMLYSIPHGFTLSP